MDIKSPNFQFLEDFDLTLMDLAIMAERYYLEDPNASLGKLRLFGELLAKKIASRMGVCPDSTFEQVKILRELKFCAILDQKLADMFHSIRIAGNTAVHEGKCTVEDALQNLRFAHQLAVHFYKVFKNPEFNPVPFQVPFTPNDIFTNLKQEHEKSEKEEARSWDDFKADIKATGWEIDFVDVPTGTFIMGSTELENQYLENQKKLQKMIDKKLEKRNVKRSNDLYDQPQFTNSRFFSPPSDVEQIMINALKEPPAHYRHEVILTVPFSISTSLITVEQFEIFVSDTGYKTDAEQVNGSIGYYWGEEYGSYRLIDYYSKNIIWNNRNLYTCYKDISTIDLLKYPVIVVSWNDANEFCSWISNRTGDTYRLPTEAEWEYACKAGSDNDFWFGDDPDKIDNNLWCTNFNSSHRTDDDGEKKGPTKTKSFPPNPYGVYDLNGNVREWCNDFFSDYPIGKVSNPRGPHFGTEKVVRGGSWGQTPRQCTSTWRTGLRPELSDTLTGFRVVKVKNDEY